MKILLAVDGSRHSDWAVNFLLKLPFSRAPRVTVFHAMEILTHLVPITPDLTVRRKFIEGLRKEKYAEAEKFVKRFKGRLQKTWSDADSEIVEGNAADEIIKKAESEGFDLIVVGSRGQAAIKSFLLGGVSQRVITYSSRSVLVVKKSVRGVKKVLLAVDGSKYSDASVRFLSENFRGRGEKITVLHAREYDLAAKAEFLEGYRAELAGSGFAAATRCLNGYPAELIIDEALKRRADLVVIGSKGVAGLRRFFLGRTTRKVVAYGKTSVLVIRNA